MSRVDGPLSRRWEAFDARNPARRIAVRNQHDAWIGACFELYEQIRHTQPENQWWIDLAPELKRIERI